MKIKIENGLALGYFTYSIIDVNKSPLSLYDLLNLFYYNYQLETWVWADIDKNLYHICSTGSITTMLNLRTMLRHVYGLTERSHE